MSSKRTIRRVLVANRGEIAVRVARTCAEMGIGTVAVARSVAAAKKTRADAVHRECRSVVELDAQAGQAVEGNARLCAVE